MAGQPVRPSAPLLARPLIPACAAGSDLAAAARAATQSDADAFAPTAPSYWRAAYDRAGRGGAALAGLTAVAALIIAFVGVICAVRRERRRRRPHAASGGTGQHWAGGLVLASASLPPATPPPPSSSSSKHAAAARTALRVTAVAGGLTALVACSLGAARTSALTASAVPDFWTGVAGGWAAALAATGAGRAAVDRLAAAATGLDALATALAATSNATALLGNTQAVQRLDLPALKQRVAGAAAEARSAAATGSAALARIDGGDPTGKSGGALGAVASFYDAWQPRSVSAAPRVRAGALAASLGLLALGAGIAAAAAAADPRRAAVPLVAAVLVALLAAGAAAGGRAGVRTARAAAGDACLFAEALAAQRVAGAAAASGTAGGSNAADGADAAVAARIARYYLDTPPASGDASGLAPAPAVGARPADRPAPNIRRGGGRDAPVWAQGATSGGSAPPPPPPSGAVTSFASSGGGRSLLAAAPSSGGGGGGLAGALGWDTAPLLAAAADPGTAALLALLASPSGEAWVRAVPGLDAEGRAALAALPASVSAATDALEAFAAASDRSAFTPALAALKRLPCCTARRGLDAWGRAWVVGGAGAAVVAAAAAGLGLWRGGRRPGP